MIFTLKSLILNNFVKKKTPSGELPTGSHLSRWASLRRPAARGLNGAENIGKTSEILWNLEIWKNI